MNSSDWNVLAHYLLTRLGERSTWVGLIGVLTAAGMTISPEAAEQIATLGAGLAGLLLIVTADKPNEPTTTPTVQPTE